MNLSELVFICTFNQMEIMNITTLMKIMAMFGLFLVWFFNFLKRHFLQLDVITLTHTTNEVTILSF